MCHMRSRTSSSGFTLIEVLLSVLIGSLVIGVIFSSYFQIVSSKERTENQLDMLHEARMIMMNLRRDLSMAFPLGKVYLENEKAESPFFVAEMEGENTRLRFTSLSHEAGLRARSSDQAEVTYYTEQNPDNGLLMLMRSENPAIGLDEGAFEYSVSERVVMFKVVFLDAAADLDSDPEDEWDSAVSESLPRAVEITLVLSNDAEEEFEFASVIKIPVGN